MVINMNYTVRESNVAKGIAILLMLVHHIIYCSPTACKTFGITNFLIPFEWTQIIGNIGKVCVNMFVFLTAFGICRKDEENSWISSAKRYIKLELNFLFVYIAIMLFSFLGRSPVEVYGKINPGGGILCNRYDGISYFVSHAYNE